MSSNNQTNDMIKWAIIIADFILLNFLIWLFADYHFIVKKWSWEMKWVFLFGNNLALLISELRFSTIVHQRIVSAGDILQRVLGLVLLQMVVAYILLKGMNYLVPSGRVMLMFAPPFFGLVILSRLIERWTINRFRRLGNNSRTVTFVGNDPELMTIYEKLKNDPTTGYRVKGYYADAEMGEWTHSQMSDGRSMMSDGNASKKILRLQTLAISHQAAGDAAGVYAEDSDGAG